MGRPQRYRGVRQRHWGSWVSEIRHPLLKTRVWLGTFETAEDAAHAYDEAARLMCGAQARTNFPYDPHAPKRPNSQLLSATLTAKLHRWHLQSQQQAADGVTQPGTKKAAQPIPCLCLEKQRSNPGSMWPKKPTDEPNVCAFNSADTASSSHRLDSEPQPANSSSDSASWLSEEDKFAAEMIEELLSWHSPGHVDFTGFVSPVMSDSSCSGPFSTAATSAASSAFVM